MRKILFKGTTHLEMQGETVLRFVSRQPDRVEYEILGYDKQKIKVIDYRQSGLNSIDYVLETENIDHFAEDFNTPAEAIIWEIDDGKLEIELHEPIQDHSQYMLWVAIGIDDQIPMYDFLFCKLQPLSEYKYALVSLYKRPSVQPVQLSPSPVFLY